MANVVHFKQSDRVFEAYGDDPQRATISRLVGPELSKTMGAGIARFDNCSITWTVLYDELIVALEGNFRLRVQRSGIQHFAGRCSLGSEGD